MRSGGVVSKLALGTVAALGLYLTSLGLPASDSCTWTAGVAGAAPTPSRSCGGDLRECLRQSADMRQTTFGGRYVTAEDVARCMEIFNACIHGGAGIGGNPVPPGSDPPPGGNSARPTPTTTGSGTQRTPSGGGAPATPSTAQGSMSGTSLPQRFRMSFQGFSNDCRVTGENITCTVMLEPLPPDIDSFQATFTGTLSDAGATGTEQRNQKGHYDNGCTFDEDYSIPVSYSFHSGGSVTLKFGAGHRQSRYSCADANSGDTVGGEVTGTWSPA